MYAVLADKPVSLNVVSGLAAIWVPSLWISYSETPTLSVDAVHVKRIPEEEVAEALTLAGILGASVSAGRAW